MNDMAMYVMAQFHFLLAMFNYHCPPLIIRGTEVTLLMHQVIYFSHTAGMTDCSPIKESQNLEEMRHLVLQDTDFFLTNGQWEKQETKWQPSTSIFPKQATQTHTQKA